MAAKNTNEETKAHLWRPCPLGKHWVSAHSRTRTSSKGKVYTQNVRSYCRTGSSHLDHLNKDEIQEVADQNFQSLKGLPTQNDLGFKGIGIKYDTLIRGWTQFWNDVLKPSDPLDSDVIKALIASESSFNKIAKIIKKVEI